MKRGISILWKWNRIPINIDRRILSGLNLDISNHEKSENEEISTSMTRLCGKLVIDFSIHQIKRQNCRYRNVNLCNITFLLTHQILINYMLALGNSFISCIRRYTDIEEEMKTKNRRAASSCYEEEKSFIWNGKV